MHKILIVDDERPSRDYIAELVSFYIPDSKVAQEDNPRDALVRLQNEDFDLLFLDIDLGTGRMNGLDLLKEIYRIGKHPYTVIISAHYKFEYAVKSIELGVTRYIPKPIDNDLSEKIDTNTMQCIVKPLYKEKIYESIQLYLSKREKDFFDFRIEDKIYRMPFDQLIAIQTIGKKDVAIYTTNCLFPKVPGSLTQLSKNLPPYFFKIERGCVVNLHKIKCCDSKKLIVYIDCENKEVPLIVSREKMKDLITSLNF